MNSSSRFTVALHIMTYMASRELAFGKERCGLVSSDELAESVNTNPVFIRRLMSQLREGGVVISERGRNGGSTLAKLPGNISLLEIYNAVEKGSMFHMHYGDPNEICPVGSNIQDCVCSVFTEAEDAMKKVFASRTLESIALEIIELSGVSDLIRQGKTFEEVKAIMMEKAAMMQNATG